MSDGVWQGMKLHKDSEGSLLNVRKRTHEISRRYVEPFIFHPIGRARERMLGESRTTTQWSTPTHDSVKGTKIALSNSASGHKLLGCYSHKRRMGLASRNVRRMHLVRDWDHGACRHSQLPDHMHHRPRP
jgi:hypothetical protein